MVKFRVINTEIIYMVKNGNLKIQIIVQTEIGKIFEKLWKIW